MVFQFAINKFNLRGSDFNLNLMGKFNIANDFTSINGKQVMIADSLDNFLLYSR